MRKNEIILGKKSLGKKTFYNRKMNIHELKIKRNYLASVIRIFNLKYTHN